MFYKYLRNNGLSSFTKDEVYKPIHLHGADKIYEWINDILENNKRVLIYGDYDCDGLMSTMVWKRFFEVLKFENFEIYKYKARTHNIDYFCVVQARTDDYDYVIISDTGSNELEQLDSITVFGAKVIVVDHHETELEYYDYGEDIAVCSTVIENRMNGNDDLRVSGAGLVFLLTDYYLRTEKSIEDIEMASYAVVALYSDAMPMQNRINRSIYSLTSYISNHELPVPIRDFTNDYTMFSKRFIQWTYAPKVNALFRSEKFQALNDYFLNGVERLPSTQRMYYTGRITDVHRLSSDLVGKVSDVISVREYTNICIGFLDSAKDYIDIEKNKVYNYTGLVANKLSQRYNKPCVVICSRGEIIKGSFRDLKDRNFLTMFKDVVTAGGHKAAFGFTFGVYELNDFLNFIKDLDIDLSHKKDVYVIEDCQDILPDRLLVGDMSRYNEFSGCEEAPKGLIRVRIRSNTREVPKEWGDYYYTLDFLTIVSKYKLYPNEVVYVTPTKSVNPKAYVLERE